MPRFTVWTNATEERSFTTEEPREAVSKYHEEIGEMPKTWDGELHVRDEEEHEITYRRREAA